MAKVKAKTGLSKVNKILFIIFIILLIATIGIIVFSSPKVAQQAADTPAASAEDTAVIDPFTAGTYGGVEFKEIADVAAYYAEAYNNTKAKTAEYNTPDGKQTFYAFVGEDDLTVESILVDGKPNGTIEKLVPSIMGSLFKKQVNGLPPSKNRNPEMDKDDVNGESLITSRLTGEDLLEANVKDNGDGTITLTMQPKAFNMSVPGMDSQGHMFSTLGDLGPTVESISVLSWASGTTEENVRVDYKGGTAVVKIDTAKKEIVEAEYTEMAYVAVKHANITIIKDKDASITIKYWQKFPCSVDYMKEQRQISPV